MAGVPVVETGQQSITDIFPWLLPVALRLVQWTDGHTGRVSNLRVQSSSGLSTAASVATAPSVDSSHITKIQGFNIMTTYREANT